DHTVAIDRHVGQGAGVAAGRDDDVLRFDRLAARHDSDAVGAGKLGGAADQSHLVLLEQRLDAADEGRDYLTAAIDSDAQIEREVSVADAKLGCALKKIGDL